MTEAEAPQERQLAALDLGSNSFHLLVVQESAGRIQVVDKLREMVRIADGLDEDNQLDPKVAERALDCLVRFGQRLRELEPENIRIVGTNTLRRARNSADFIKRAEALLGAKVEIISGREEARLIYLGVSHALEDNADRRLVIDIGGGSTELILGRHSRAERMESLYMGCVGITRAHFSDGRLRGSQFKAAIASARQELEPIEQSYREAGWDTVIGASGTILTAQTILGELLPGGSGITLKALHHLREVIQEAKSIDRLNLPGLPSERAPVFAGGLAVLIGVFESLGIEQMQATSGALREGLIQDMLGRVHHQDVREGSVQDLSRRYHVDQAHARRVRESAIELLAQAARDWQLTEAEDRLLLGWAAELHEIGMDIAHSQYHKHGEYLLNNMDMQGFSRLDQHYLAMLVRTHRRKFPTDLPDMNDRLIHLSVLLRISVVLHRSRSTSPLPHINLRVGPKKIELGFPQGWLDDHPLTRLDIEQETRYLKPVGLELSIAG
ncbi:MAG: Ppx/GppA family phosphatase [Pseudomonadales bacterium]|nr:Ppx/GppA family phosphatase [Pseudomonadales bacterium]